VVFNSQLLVEVPKCVVELLSIIRGEDLGDSEVTNDAFPDESWMFFLVIVAKGSTSTYLLKQSIPTTRNLSCRIAMGKSHIMLRPH